MKHRSMALAFALVSLTLSSACIDTLVSSNDISKIFMTMLGATKSADRAKAKPKKLNAELSVQVMAHVSGLPLGQYDVYVSSNHDGHQFGHFTGTGKITNKRFVTIHDAGSDGLKALVAGMAKEALNGEDVTVTSASATIKAHEAPGGTSAAYSAVITFKGTVTSGADAGSTITKGTIKAGNADMQ